VCRLGASFDDAEAASRPAVRCAALGMAEPIDNYLEDGNLVSLEILDASKRVTEARRIEFETVG
jgi:hypothetical protein